MFTAEFDYSVPGVRTVTFQSGTREVLYGIPIVNDDDNESPEMFTTSLATMDPNVNIVDDGATVTIIDDDDEEGMLFSIISVGCVFLSHVNMSWSSCDN